MTGVIFDFVGGLAAELPGGSAFAGVLNMLHKTIFRSYGNMGRNDALCYVSKYMSDEFAKNMQTFERWYNADKGNCMQMELLFSKMEAVTVIDKLRVYNEEDKARWYNLIVPWTTLHLAVYEKIITNRYCRIHNRQCPRRGTVFNRCRPYPSFRPLNPSHYFI